MYSVGIQNPLSGYNKLRSKKGQAYYKYLWLEIFYYLQP